MKFTFPKVSVCGFEDVFSIWTVSLRVRTRTYVRKVAALDFSPEMDDLAISGVKYCGATL